MDSSTSTLPGPISGLPHPQATVERLVNQFQVILTCAFSLLFAAHFMLNTNLQSVRGRPCEENLQLMLFICTWFPPVLIGLILIMMEYYALGLSVLNLTYTFQCGVEATWLSFHFSRVASTTTRPAAALPRDVEPQSRSTSTTTRVQAGEPRSQTTPTSTDSRPNSPASLPPYEESASPAKTA